MGAGTLEMRTTTWDLFQMQLNLSGFYLLTDY